MTLDSGDNVRSMAIDLQDTQLLTRIEGGCYRSKVSLSCLTELRNRHCSFLRKKHCSNNNFEVSKIEAGAFVELISHIETSVESGTCCFKLSSLRQIYPDHFSNLGISKEINKVRFKEQIIQKKA